MSPDQQPKLISSREMDKPPEKDQNDLLDKIEEGNKEGYHTVILIEGQS